MTVVCTKINLGWKGLNACLSIPFTEVYVKSCNRTCEVTFYMVIGDVS